MNEVPEVRLTLDGMRYSIVQAFVKHNDQIEKYVDEQLEHLIKSFDFKKEIEKMAIGIFQDQIRMALKNAVASLGWDESVRKALATHILRELTEGDDTKRILSDYFAAQHEIVMLKKEIAELKANQK